ncbi:c-type cytochrome [Rhodoplanes sp. SY1]|uniref:c-type cytochrome n=1 Tax=Rhodoplanes sp. SY1 TaxID=3166646 RepID=UPI0038B5D0B0
MRPIFGVLVITLATAACQRESRELRLDPPVAAALDGIRLMPNRIGGAPPQVYTALDKPYETNAYAIAEGKRLYAWFGCRDCHGDGEGGKGPAFLDGWWAYGPDMVSIVASIRDGRPHGMPAFRDKLTREQIWQLAGYVQTIGAYSAKIAAPGRSDTTPTRPAENRAPAAIRFDPGPTPLHPDQGPEP